MNKLFLGLALTLAAAVPTASQAADTVSGTCSKDGCWVTVCSSDGCSNYWLPSTAPTRSICVVGGCYTVTCSASGCSFSFAESNPFEDRFTKNY